MVVGLVCGKRVVRTLRVGSVAAKGGGGGGPEGFFCRALIFPGLVEMVFDLSDAGARRVYGELSDSETQEAGQETAR